MQSIIEGLLMIVGDDGVSVDQLCEVCELDKSVVLEHLKNLKEKYASKDHGFELINYGGFYKFVSKTIVYDYAKKLYQSFKKSELSQSALETLAIIAYKQPITRLEIEELRGVGCDMMLRKLQAKDLIKEVGRADTPGKPVLYAVTNQFLDVFKLVSLDELPDLPSYEISDNENLFD